MESTTYLKYMELWHSVKREGINKLINFIEKSDMKTAPASTRFHSAYKGGLVTHSLNVYNMLINKAKNDPVWKEHLKDVSDETLIIVALAHDFCKLYFYNESTRNVKDENGKWVQVPYYIKEDKYPLGHGSKSVIFLQQFIKLTMEEIMAINWHMGFSVPKEDYGYLGDAFAKYPLAVALHEADLEATYLLEEA